MLYSLLQKAFQKIKDDQKDVVLSAVIILITVISFQSGKISALKNRGEESLTIKEAPLEEIFVNSLASDRQTTSGLDNFNKQDNFGIGTFSVIASKNSTKYHFPWCSGASKISDQNKITFPTEAAAIAAGLTLASNCKK